MNAGSRILFAAVGQLPLLVVVAIVALLLTGLGGSKNEAVATAVFVDRDEYGHVSSLTFEDECPNLEGLAKLPGLWRLTLKNSSLNDETFRSLSRLPSLSSLSLEGCRFPADLWPLAGDLSNLKELDLRRTSNATQSLARLHLPSLHTIRLGNSDQVNDDTLVCLKKFSALQTVGLRNTSITDAGIPHLAELPAIQSLTLDGCDALGDGTLLALQSASSLTNLMMPSKRLSLAAAQGFQQTLPSARLFAPLRDFQELQQLLHRREDDNFQASVHTAFDTGNFCNGLPSVAITANAEPSEQHVPAAVNLTVLPLVPGLTGLRLTGTAIVDDVLVQIGELKDLQSLDLAGSAVTDDGLAHIVSLKNLESLDLSHTQVTDEGLSRLLGLQNLRRLSLSGISHSDRTLEILSQFPRMFDGSSHWNDQLDLSDSKVTGRGLSFLVDGKFHWADLSGLPLTDEDLKVLSTWNRLRAADLSRTLFTGATLDLRTNSQLQSLRLDHTKLTDETLRQMQLPDSITILSLSHTSITGRTLPELAVGALHTLELAGTRLTEQGLANALRLKMRHIDLTGVLLTRIPELDADDFPSQLKVDGSTPIYEAIPETRLAQSLKFVTIVAAQSKNFDVALRIPNLESLYLVDSTFNADSFRRLSDHPTLNSIWLENCQPDAAAIRELAEIRNLKKLIVETHDRKAEGFDVLTKLRPELYVNCVDQRGVSW